MSPIRRPAVICPPTADDAAFLRRVERVSLRQGTRRARYLGGVGWLRRRLGILSRRVALLMALLAASAGLAIASAPPASADITEPNTWCERDSHNPQLATRKYWRDAAEADAYVDPATPATRWAQYGAAGTYWETYWLDCFDRRHVTNMAANQVFDLSKSLSVLTITIFESSFNGDLIGIFVNDEQGVAGSGATLNQLIDQLQVAFFLQLFSLAVLIGALVIAFRFLVKRDGGSALLGRFAAMVLVAGLGFFYGGTPGGNGPNAAAVVKTVSGWANQIAAVTLLAFSSEDCENPALLNAGVPAAERDDMPTQCVAQYFYDTLIFEPWAIGELGEYEVPPRKEDGSAGDRTPSQLLAERIHIQQAYSFYEIEQNKNDDGTPNQQHYRLERDEYYTDEMCTKTDEYEDVDNLATYTGKLCDRETMRRKVVGIADDEFDNYGDPWSAITASNQTLWEVWSGGTPGVRWNMAMMAMLASIFSAFLLGSASVAYLFLQFAVVLFAIVAPVFFLFGLIRLQILLRYLELFANVFVKQIMLGVAVGLCVGLWLVTLSTSIHWMLRLIILFVFTLFGLIYRKPFTQAVSFNFGGGDIIHKDGEIASSAATRAVAGAMGSRRSGGNALGGAIYGVGRGAMPGAGQVYDTAMSRNVNARPRGSRTRRSRVNP